MKRSEIYREAAARVAGMNHIYDRPFFFRAFPGGLEGSYEAARDFVCDYVDWKDGLTMADPDVRVLFLCFMAALSEWEEEQS